MSKFTTKIFVLNCDLVGDYCLLATEHYLYLTNLYHGMIRDKVLTSVVFDNALFVLLSYSPVVFDIVLSEKLFEYTGILLVKYWKTVTTLQVNLSRLNWYIWVHNWHLSVRIESVAKVGSPSFFSVLPFENF